MWRITHQGLFTNNILDFKSKELKFIKVYFIDIIHEQSLFSTQHVLTAAHCNLINISLDSITVYAGLQEYSEQGTAGAVSLSVSGVVEHPEYHVMEQEHYNDLAIITLETPVQFNHNIRPVCLPADIKAQSIHQEGKTHFQFVESKQNMFMYVLIISSVWYLCI